VALVSPTLGRGGAERQMLILAGALPRDEVDLRFVVLAEGGPLAAEAEALGIPVRTLGLTRNACRIPGPGCGLAIARAVRRYARLTRDVDIVDAWLVPALTFAGLMQPLARVPVLVAGRRSLAHVARHRSAIRRRAASLAMRNVDAFVANSTAGARELVEMDGVEADRVRVIPNAVLPAPTAEDSLRLREAARGRWEVSPDELLVGCVTNLQPGKGLPELVAAASELRRGRSNLRFAVIGEGPLRPLLERSIVDRGLGDVVVLAGGDADARQLYPAFDIAVQVSESESLPNAVLEAAAAGLPIVATAVGGTVEILDDGRNGVLVPARDVRALVTAVAGLAGDAQRRRRLGDAARARAADFDPRALATATLRLYRSLLGLAPRGPIPPHLDAASGVGGS
jgi:glycosyltransferase involved in cell wall biosynthesis